MARNKIRIYDKMEIVAVKGVSGKPYVEFCMGDDFVNLDREAMIDLIRVVEQALLQTKGFAATDIQRDDIRYEG